MKTNRSLGLRIARLVACALLCLILWCLDAHAMDTLSRRPPASATDTSWVVTWDEDAVPPSVLERCVTTEELDAGRHRIEMQRVEPHGGNSSLLIEGEHGQPIVLARTETVHVWMCRPGRLWICPLEQQPLRRVKLILKSGEPGESDERDPLETQVDEDPLTVDPCSPWELDRLEIMVDSED